tara:strand:- start:492 stop:950 length:459 start_codon:yes stop_codon:yes gene_type:complete
MKIILKNDQATIELGKLIAREIESLKKSSIEIHLEGDLGTGKTFLTKSIIKSSGWNEHVKSPTYTLCEEYDLGDLIFLHIDLYRTNEADDILIFDLDRDTHVKKVIIIEWPQKLIHQREFDLKISFKHIDNGREVSIISNDNKFHNLSNINE